MDCPALHGHRHTRNQGGMSMEHGPDATPEPTLVDLAERFDNEGMVGFTRMFHEDLRNGFDAVNEERFPWLPQRHFGWKCR